ncbi:hypothetical protein FRC17_010316 [Serendipita sp. 399]|nr:hypothetical protein FRC17_010316 [Serendipita sp. 399]
MNQNESCPSLSSRNGSLGTVFLTKPDNWSFTSSFDPSALSQNESLQCLRVELATNSEQALVVILDIRYFGLEDQDGLKVKIVVGGMGINTTVASATHDKPTSLWGVLPKNLLSHRLDITLQVVTGENDVRDELEIGAVFIADPNEQADLEQALKDTRQMIKKPHKRASFTETETEKGLVNLEIPPGFSQLEFTLDNDPRAATRKWTQAELNSGRRLVRFWRQQTGSLVRLSFSTHSDKESYEDQDSTVISCIRWPEEEKGFFVTSFDVVRLAEFALHLTMSTEMKNRARRNMAAVSSTTLPKVKDISDNPSLLEATFFLVMGFENPRARSIEKSIKVFDWYNLSECLSRILQRFIIPDSGDGSTAMEFEHQLDATRKWKRMKSVSTSRPNVRWRPFTRPADRRSQTADPDDINNNEDDELSQSSQELVVPPPAPAISPVPMKEESHVEQVPSLVMPTDPEPSIGTITRGHPSLSIRTSSLPHLVTPLSSQGDAQQAWSMTPNTAQIYPSPTETYPPSYYSPSSVGSTSSSRNGSFLDLPDVPHHPYQPHMIHEGGTPLPTTPAPMLNHGPGISAPPPVSTPPIFVPGEWNQSPEYAQNMQVHHPFQQPSTLMPRPAHPRPFFVQTRPRVIAVDPRSLSGNMIPHEGVPVSLPPYAFTPTCLVYPVVVPLSRVVSASVPSIMLKEEQDDVNTDDWLDNDFIMAEEQEHKVEP